MFIRSHEWNSLLVFYDLRSNCPINLNSHLTAVASPILRMPTIIFPDVQIIPILIPLSTVSRRQDAGLKIDLQSII